LEIDQKLSAEDMPLLNNLYEILYKDKSGYEVMTKLLQ